VHEDRVNIVTPIDIIVLPKQEDLLSPLQRLRAQFFTKYFFNVLMMSFGFLITLGAYGSAQGLMTSLHEELGFICLAVLYGVFAFTNFTAPAIVQLIGPKWGIVIASIPYSLFCLACGSTEPIILVSASIMMGFAASVLWTSQGSLLTECGQGVNMGFYSGVFCCIFGLNGVLGNVIIGALLTYEVEQIYVFLVMFGVGMVSLLFFLPIRTISQIRVNDQPVDKKSAKTILRDMIDSIKKTIYYLIDKKMLLLIPLYLYNGYSNSFFFGIIPPKIPLFYVPWINLTFSLSQPFVALGLGKGSDIFGIRWMMAAAFIAHITATILSYFIFEIQEIWLYFVTIFICGIAYSGTTTEIFAVLGSLFKDSPSSAFAAFNFVQALSTAMSLLSAIYLTYYTILIIMTLLLILAMIGFLILDFKVQRVDKLKKVQQLPTSISNVALKDITTVTPSNELVPQTI
jgi:MFS family permease